MAASSQKPQSTFADVPVRWVVAWLLLAALGAMILNHVRGARVTPTIEDWPVLVGHGGVLAWIVLTCRRRNCRLSDLFGPSPRTLREFVPMLAGPCFWMASHAFGLLFAAAVLPHGLLLSRQADLVTAFLPTTATPGRLVLAVALVLLAAPISEELLFRRILLDRWTHTLGVRIAQVLSICLFALLHGRILWALCLGILLTALYVRSGSLWTSIGAHSLGNAAALVWVMITRLSVGPSGTLPEPSDALPQLCAAVVAGVLGIIIVFRVYLPSTAARPSFDAAGVSDGERPVARS